MNSFAVKCKTVTDQQPPDRTDGANLLKNTNHLSTFHLFWISSLIDSCQNSDVSAATWWLQDFSAAVSVQKNQMAENKKLLLLKGMNPKSIYYWFKKIDCTKIKFAHADHNDVQVVERDSSVPLPKRVLDWSFSLRVSIAAGSEL